VKKIEVIEDGKRKFVKWNCVPAFMLQDGGRALKIFIDGEKVKKELDDVAIEVDIPAPKMLVDAFDLLGCIDSIAENKRIENLKALRKILDARIKKLESPIKPKGKKKMIKNEGNTN